MADTGVKATDIAAKLEKRHGDKALAVAEKWINGLMKPVATQEDIEAIANLFSVEADELKAWSAKHVYAPQSARKVRLVADLIRGRHTSDALDILKFTEKRAATFVSEVLKSAIANADEAEADIDSLYVAESRVDSAGRRIGTKGFIPKDRGRAHPIKKEACHIHVTLAQIVEE
jgi:large subunit ribosomal protein L22